MDDSSVGDPVPHPFLFLIVDAIPFELAHEAWRTGALAGFAEPRPMVSVFPSLTNVAVGALLQGVFDEVPLGYEARHFDPISGTIHGGFHDPSSEGGLLHLHGRLKGVLGHLAVYFLRASMVHREVEEITRSFLRQDKPWLAYVPATDGVAHFGGRSGLQRAFADVCHAVATAREEHRRHTGTALGVVMCSDHGMAFGRFSHLSSSDLAHRLRAAGFDPDQATDRRFMLVAYGDVGGGVVYAPPHHAVEVAELVARAPGVDVAFGLNGDGCVAFALRDGRLLRGCVSWRGDTYGYQTVEGDPLDYADVWETLGRERLLHDGWASDGDLFAATWSHRYPDALARVRHGLLDLVRAPAPVLFSMKQNWTYGPPLTHLGAGLMGGQVGTHGALSADESNGFAICTTEVETPAWHEHPALRPQQVLRPWRSLVATGAAT